MSLRFGVRGRMIPFVVNYEIGIVFRIQMRV